MIEELNEPDRDCYNCDRVGCPGCDQSVYNPTAWETYSRDAKCGCTAPDPADCSLSHGTGAWLCVCHRLSGPPLKETDAPGMPLALLPQSEAQNG